MLVILKGYNYVFLSTDLYQLFNTIKKGDVISFEKTLNEYQYDFEYAAVVDGIAGQTTNLEMIDTNQANLSKKVPTEHVAVKFGITKQSHAVNKRKITGVAWLALPFK